MNNDAVNACASAVKRELMMIGEPKSLADLAARIKTEHEATATALKRGAEHAMAAGDLLIDAKAQVQHGQWLQWLRGHCGGISERMAQRYMRLAESRTLLEAKSDTVSDLTIRGAMELLALAPPDPAVEGDVADDKSSGEPVLEEDGAEYTDRDLRNAPAEPQPATGHAGVMLEAAAEQKGAAEVATQPIERQPQSVAADRDQHEPAAEPQPTSEPQPTEQPEKTVQERCVRRAAEAKQHKLHRNRERRLHKMSIDADVTDEKFRTAYVDLHRPSTLTDHRHVQVGLDLLVDLNHLAKRELATGGHPKTVYTINPRTLR